MASSKRESNQERTRLKEQIYEMMCIKHLPVIDVMKKTGLKKKAIFHYLHDFEKEKRRQAEEHNDKRETKINPDDYKKLLEERARLKKSLNSKSFVQTTTKKCWLL